MSFLNNSIKILFLLIPLFFLGCDFRIPQEWETPEWQFDLNIPLINEEYAMSSIASTSNDIQITSPDSSDFMISVNERIIEPGTVVTDESFFIIEESSLEFSLDGLINIENPNPMPSIPSINENITMQSLFSGIMVEEGTCIPKTPPGLDNGYDTTIVVDIDSFCEDFGDIDCLDEIDWVSVESGNNILEINNQLPIIINQLELNINSEGVGSFVSVNLPSEDYPSIDGLITEESFLDDKQIGCEVNASLYFKIDTPLQPSSNSEDCNICEESGNLPIDDECYIAITLTEDTCPQIEANGINAEWINNQCYMPIILNEEGCSQIDNAEWNEVNEECRLISDLPQLLCAEPLIWDSELEQCYVVYELNSSNCEQNGWNWLDNQNGCYQLIEINSSSCEENGWDWLNEQNGCYLACTEEQECCESITGTWENGECTNIPSFDGFKILSDPNDLTLNISNSMNLNSFKSIKALIRDCDIPATYSIPLPSNPNMTLVEGYISPIVHPDTNRVTIDLTNNLFSEIYVDINSPNLIDSVGNSLIIDRDTISINESFDDIILSDYIIKNLDGSAVDSLEMTFQINIPEGYDTIQFDNSYGLSGSGVNVKTTKLEALKVNLNEFSSPDINMGSVPSGLDGFNLPFLSFNLHMYNQISADMKLFLDIYGINDEDTLKIHVEPDIKFLDLLDPYSDTDSLTISFYQDTMLVKHKGNGISHGSSIKTVMDNKITDLFSYDIIDVSGYAIMNGDATLLPNKSLWGDIEITIQPLTLIIEDSEKFGFIASEFTELAIMDSDISAKIDSGLISATIDMNLNNQLPFSGNLLMYISNNPDYFPFCIDSLQTGLLVDQEVSDSCKNYINDYLGCENFSIDADSNFVKHLDCITINDETYYYENLLNIEFLPPTLDGWGNVLDSVLSQQEIILDDEIYYFTKDNLQYLIPRFVFNSALDTITLQPNNSLNINSSIMFKLLSTGLLE